MSAPPARDWHALPGDEVVAHLEVPETGLSAAEAARRRERHGPNALPQPPRRSAWMRLALQFHNVLIYILIAAGAITAALGHLVDSAVIFGVVLANAAIGHVQEGKAETAIASIRRMLSLTATVVRDGRRQSIDAEALVPGDLVMLASGDKVPADLRLLKARGLRLEEAALTGESVPVDKAPASVAADAPLGDRVGMAYAGTLVAHGQGLGAVVATGADTELGRISRMIAAVEELDTPLVRKMGQFARGLSAAILVVAAAAFAFGVYVRGYTAAEMFLAAVGIAVAAIPEGLPAIMTITLAIGVQRMARRKAIVRRLPAVEALGSVTVICSDKTGTLTRNEMTVRSVSTADATVAVEGAGYAPHGALRTQAGPVGASGVPGLAGLARAAVLCNDACVHESGGAWHVDGDPTEGALLAFGWKAGFEPKATQDAMPRVDAIPFESEHRFMATLHEAEGATVAIVKGAPERLLAMCVSQLAAGGEVAVDTEYWKARMDEAAGLGMRLLMFATRRFEDARRDIGFGDVETGLCLLGLVGMIDPPREEATAAVAQCRAAGIRVKMITGDHGVTAHAIGMQLGLGAQPALTGAQIEALDDAALRRSVEETDVFARASPEHKLRLVKALQANGEVVAMTGDGVNDAPALKRADIGVAMGLKGTEAAKEAGEMVLADDNFATIAHAVEEGRAVYDNLKKSLIFILPTNGGEAGMILVAIAFGMVLPITPVQILWVNTITSVTLALALAFEPPERDAMARPPRPPAEPILSGALVWRIVFVSTLLVVFGIGLFLWETARGSSLEAARTVAVGVIVVGELFYLFNARQLVAPAMGPGIFANPWAWVAAAVLVLAQVAFVHWAPMQALFGTVGLDARQWALVVASGALLFVLVELEKGVQRFLARTRPRGLV